MASKMGLNERIEKAARDENFIHVRVNPRTETVDISGNLTASGLVTKGKGWTSPDRILVQEVRMIGTADAIRSYLKEKSTFTAEEIENYLRRAITADNYQTGRTGEEFADLVEDRHAYVENQPKKPAAERPDLFGLMGHVNGVKLVDSKGPKASTGKLKGGKRARTLLEAYERAVMQGQVLNVTNAKFGPDGSYTSNAVIKNMAKSPQSIFGTPAVPYVVANKDNKVTYEKAMKALAAEATTDADKRRFMEGARQFKDGEYDGATDVKETISVGRSTRGGASRARTTARRSPSPVRAAPTTRRSPSPVRTTTTSPRRRRRAQVGRQ